MPAALWPRAVPRRLPFAARQAVPSAVPPKIVCIVQLLCMYSTTIMRASYTKIAVSRSENKSLPIVDAARGL